MHLLDLQQFDKSKFEAKIISFRAHFESKLTVVQAQIKINLSVNPFALLHYRTVCKKLSLYEVYKIEQVCYNLITTKRKTIQDLPKFLPK